MEIHHEERPETIVFLHGFTGSTKTWHPLVSAFGEYRVVLIDLLGHGRTESPEDPDRYSMDRQTEDLHELFTALGLSGFILTGYSMGGRTALAYACTHPENISQLILESASPGLPSPEERHERRLRDERLAARIIEGGVPAFTDYWERIPMFGTQSDLPEPARQRIREERLGQRAEGLAGSLVGMGTGAQASYWDCLARLPFPVVLLTGIKDEKFTGIARGMMERLQNGTHTEVDAGHAIHVEKPEEFATIIKKQLNL